MKQTLLTMPRYREYKDSGHTGFGDIPVDWSVLKLKHLVDTKAGFAFPSDSFSDEGIPVIRIGDLLCSGYVSLESSPKLSYKFTKYLEEYAVFYGDILMAMTGGTIGKVSEYLSNEDALLNQRVCRFLPKRGIVRELLLHWMRSSYWHDYIDLTAFGGAQPNISDNETKEMYICLPETFAEQRAISDFLDKKTAQMDEAIAIKEKQIELLKERKQILIQKAVTQGLDSSVPMKDSGVDWIGRIPESWGLKKMKFIFELIQTGNTPATSNPKYFDGGVDWYNPKDLNAGYLDKPEKTISKLAIKHGEAKIFSGDSVLIVGIGATCGKTAYLKEASSFNQQITGFNSRCENSEFMYFLISTYSKVMLNVANYTTLPILNNEFFKHFMLPCPPRIEQDNIVSFLSNESEKLEQTIEMQQQQIEKLKEYKTTLINSAVTGKIKVS